MDVQCDEVEIQSVLTRGTVVSLNVGPVGLASSLPTLAPILAMRPVAVLLQEAHVPAGQLQSMRALIHKHYPAYCLFASRKARSGGKVDIITLVHIKMAARASLLDISKEFAPLAAQAPEALARVHFVRILDPEGQVSVLLGNVHQYQARESMPQAAVHSLITRVLARWGADSQHAIVGGDWNASLAPRLGYAVETATSEADARFAQWVREAGLSYIPPRSHTWTDGRRRAVLDAFVVREPSSLDHPTCVESRDPRHDHRAVLAALLDERVGPMPELEALLAPVRLKLEALREPEQRRTYLERAKAAVEASAGVNLGPFERLAQMQSVVLQVAKGTLGTRGGKIRPMLPQHSPSFQRLAAYIRLLRVVRREIWDRRGAVLPASRAMSRLWHREKEVFPEDTTFDALGELAGNAGWSRRAAAGLRAHLHRADEDSLRSCADFGARR